MSKFTKTAQNKAAVNKSSNSKVMHKEEGEFVQSFEGGAVFKPSSKVRQLKRVLASSIFGEPSFYESADTRAKNTINLINEALEEDFVGTLQLAVELRSKAWMRLNPSVIVVLAAIHPKRKEHTEKNAGLFKDVVKSVAQRVDDLTTMVEFYIHVNGSKNNMPNVLKRAIAKRLEEFDNNAYALNKYKNRGIGLIDVIRMVHPKGAVYLRELVQTGDVTTKESEQTWMSLRSLGKEWKDIVNQVQLTHQDILFQLRSLVAELSSEELQKVLDYFQKTQEKSRVFPYRYFILHNVLEQERMNKMSMNYVQAIKAVRNIFQLSTKTKLKGTTAVLVDVSSSMSDTALFKGGTFSCMQLAAVGGALAAAQCENAVIVPFATSATVLAPESEPFAVYDNIIEQSSRLGWGTDILRGLAVLEEYAKGHKIDNIIVYTDNQISSSIGTVTQGSVGNFLKNYRTHVNKHLNFMCVSLGGYLTSVVQPKEYEYCSDIVIHGFTGSEIEYLKEIDAIGNGIG